MGLDPFMLTPFKRNKDCLLPVNVYAVCGIRYKWKPRIYIQDDYNDKWNMKLMIPVTIRDRKIRKKIKNIRKPDIDLILQFIEMNEKVLLDHWIGKSDSIELWVSLKFNKKHI